MEERTRRVSAFPKSREEEADARVERSLYQRACGYEYDAVKIFCSKDGQVTQVEYRERIPPDTTACIFWLKNRKKADWRDKIDHEHAGGVGLTMITSVPRPDRNGA